MLVLRRTRKKTRIRYNAIAIAAPSERIPPRLLAILDGPAEGIIQFHEFPGAGSIGDEKRGDLMAGFTKPPPSTGRPTKNEAS